MRMASTPDAARKPRKVLRQCQVEGCGKTFYGHTIRKYCDEHREEKKVRLQKLYGNPDDNVKITMDVRKSETMVLQCKLCGDEFRVIYIPKVDTYPAYCEKHRNEFKRGLYMKEMGMEPEVMVSPAGVVTPSLSGFRSNIDDDDDEAMVMSTGNDGGIGMRIRSEMSMSRIEDSGLDRDVIAELSEIAGTEDPFEMVDVDIGAPADSDMSNEDAFEMAMSKLNVINSADHVFIQERLDTPTIDTDADMATFDIAVSSNNIAVSSNNIAVSSNNIAVANNVNAVETTESNVAIDDVAVGVDSVQVGVPTNIVNHTFNPEMTSDPLRSKSQDNDAGIQISGSHGFGARIVNGGVKVYSKVQLPGMKYELSGFQCQYDHGGHKSALRIQMWFSNVDDLKSCFSGSRFTDPDGSSGLIIVGAPAINVDDIEVSRYIEGKWVR